MYVISNKKNKYKMKDKKVLIDIKGFLFGSKNKSHKIAGEKIIDLTIYSKKLAHPIAKKQVDLKYHKLINLITELLVSDSDEGACNQEVLNQIEKFRQIIKNKYRDYLTKKELEEMGKQLTLLRTEAQKNIIQLNRYIIKNTNRKSSSK